MFGFLKKKETDYRVYAPVGGKVIDMTEVDDPGFSCLAMGDGVAVIPEERTIKAPCDGTISMIFRTGHAFGINADNGLELLVHIGIDTVNLDGKGFKVLKSENDKVRTGDPIVEIDLEEIKKEYDTSTMLIVTNGVPIEKSAVGRNVAAGEEIFKKA